MAMPPLTARAALREPQRTAGSPTAPRGRGLVPQQFYTIQACTRRLAQNAPGTHGVPGLSHCYLRFTSIAPSPEYPTFTKSFGPGESGPEHFEAAATTRCYNVGGSVGARVYTFDQVRQVVAVWDDFAAQYGNYGVLDNNCCTHVIQTLQRAGLPVPPEITQCNLGFN